MSPSHQDLSNDTTFSPIKSLVPVPLNLTMSDYFSVPFLFLSNRK